MLLIPAFEKQNKKRTEERTRVFRLPPTILRLMKEPLESGFLPVNLLLTCWNSPAGYHTLRSQPRGCVPDIEPQLQKQQHAPPSWVQLGLVPPIFSVSGSPFLHLQCLSISNASPTWLPSFRGVPLANISTYHITLSLSFKWARIPGTMLRLAEPSGARWHLGHHFLIKMIFRTHVTLDG